VRQAAILHELLMGAQDNLTNVLAVMLGVMVGAGRADLAALAGASAAIAEAVSMGGVLYSSTRAGTLGTTDQTGAGAQPARLGPVASGLVTFGAALGAGLLPLVPYALFVPETAIVVSMVVSLGALFALGTWTGRLAGGVWWHEGARLLVVGTIAAVAAALTGAVLRVG
jgi:VIT1/CCC1 family predicted Fe2+/Mn2+ transporter